MDYKTLINKVSEASGIDVEECEAFHEAFTELLESTLASGDSVSIPSFGNFEPRKRNERIISNPSVKGKRFMVPPKIVASFRSSTVLKNKINNVTGDE